MALPNWQNRTVWTANNLMIMRGMDSETVDLVYLDPPFNSNRNYAAPDGSQAEGAAFDDTWVVNDMELEGHLAEWIDYAGKHNANLRNVLLATMTASDKFYLVHMAMRLVELHRLLKPTGSIYMHCDPTMSHYLKLVMDAIFDRGNFRNEIVWCYHAGGTSQNHFPRKHDLIFLYGKDATRSLHNVIRGIPYEGYDAFDSDGNIRVNAGYSLDGKMVPDWWVVSQMSSTSKERTGYPTQKPLVLLQRIIRASSNPGDMVLDPFAGSGTTCVAAEIEGRQWTGIDESDKATKLIVERASSDQGLFQCQVHNRVDVPVRTIDS